MVNAQVVQSCPICQAKYDVGIYVSGQKVRCRRCGNKFVVVRNDTHVAAKGLGPPKPAEAPARPAPGGKAAPLTVHDRAAAAEKGRRREDPVIPPGSRVDGYVIEKVLGKGAMGTVYKATQLSLERTVALKAMANDLVGQPEFVLRFRREAAALAALAHQNVVSIIDQGRSGDLFYFVMEYVDGPTLRSELQRRAVTLPQAFDYALQIGRGLMYAHAKGVVHRDLKPENILLAADGAGGRIAKICDFGLADILFSDRSYVNLTGSRISMGTVNYMAPEQRQDAGRVDQRADVFSYGVMVYELLTGELPVGRFLAPSEKNPKVDRRLDPLILRALDQDARRRYPFVKEMVEKLEAVRSNRL